MKKVIFPVVGLFFVFALVSSFTGCGLAISTIQNAVDRDGSGESKGSGGADNPGGTESSAILSRSTLYTSSISYAPLIFTFSATSGTSYRIYWRDYNLYNIFADINVAVGSGSPVNVTSSGETFGGQYCFYQTYTATSTGTVTIRVSIQSLGLNGTFYIGYN